jgi:hypothetical protein
MADYSGGGVVTLPIPDFQIHADGRGERTWTLRFRRGLDDDGRTLLEQLLVRNSAAETGFTVQDVNGGCVRIRVASRPHPASDTVMFATRRLFGQLLASTFELAEIEGLDVAVWRRGWRIQE